MMSAHPASSLNRLDKLRRSVRHLGDTVDNPADPAMAVASVHGMTQRRPARQIIPSVPGESIRWLEHDYPASFTRMRYHPEYEIHLIRHGRGRYYIGDRVGEFKPGHVALIGPDLQHDWVSDVAPGEVIAQRDALIQFRQSWVDGCLAALPEMGDALHVLRASRGGIVVAGRTARLAAAEIEAVGITSGSHRLAHMFALISVFADAPDHDLEYLTVDQFATPAGDLPVEAGIEHILANLTGEVRLADVARALGMSVPAYSKHFHRVHGRTFTDVVRRLRIARACRLLGVTDEPIASISVAVGYPNLANFNRQFRSVVGMTPREYRALPDDRKPTIPSAR